MKDYSYRNKLTSPQDFVITDVKTLQLKVEELENAVKGLYDIIEELAKKI